MPPYGFDVICKSAGWALERRFVQTGRRKGIWIRGDLKEEVTGLPITTGQSGVRHSPARSLYHPGAPNTLVRIFQIFDSEATSTLQIARKLNDEGISPVLANKWDHSKVWGLLQNPASLGDLRPTRSQFGKAAHGVGRETDS